MRVQLNKMMAKTHMVFGLFVGLISLFIIKPYSPLIFLPIVIFSSLLPDIDSPTSKLGRKISPISFFLNMIFGHRGFFHSLFFPVCCFLLVFTASLWFKFSFIYAVAVAIGILSHIAIDAITIEGVDLFSPFLRIKIAGFVPTGSLIELMIFVAISLGCVFIFVKQFFLS
jgi:inner membrane protein